MSRRKLRLVDGNDEMKIEFPYDQSLLPVVRALTRRRFDRAERAWFCPREVLVEAVDALVPHGFSTDAEVDAAYRAGGGTGPVKPPKDGEASLFGAPKATAAPRVGEPKSADGSLTVRELNQRVKLALRREFPQDLWIVGEIVGFDRNSHRPTVHFELAEKEGEGEKAEVSATVSAVMFGRARGLVEERLAASPESFELRDGLEVRMKVRVDLYEARGSFQVIVEDIDPVHTLGRIAQSRARVLAELDRLGLRERNLGLPLPLVPLRVGLVTSAGSDAMNDFKGELERSGFRFRLTVIDARMQGQSLQGEVVGALRRLVEGTEEFDAVAIVRGGGSKSDLAWFDDLQVALAVARCPLKVIVGIGHHRDMSVLDLIAHREKTPTAAAALLVERVREFERRLQRAGTQLAQRATRKVQAHSELLLSAGRRLERAGRSRLQLAEQAWQHRVQRLGPLVRRLLRERELRGQDAAERLRRFASARLRERRMALTRSTQRVATTTTTRLRLQEHGLDVLRRGLDPERLARWTQGRGRRLEDLRRRAESLDPRRVLQRGFAWIQDAQGRSVRDAGQVPQGARLKARLAQGSLDLEVLDAQPAVHEESSPPAAEV